MIAMLKPAKTFQPTLPARGATRKAGDNRRKGRHFNPRSPHGERQEERKNASWEDEISTHAPRTGSDSLRCWSVCFRATYFNPRSPHGERPMFTETSLSYIVISTHAPRTGSDPVAPAPADKPAAFQPTLPARGATKRMSLRRSSCVFQPTLPARGATRVRDAPTRAVVISTHAPRTGSDGFPP